MDTSLLPYYFVSKYYAYKVIYENEPVGGKYFLGRPDNDLPPVAISLNQRHILDGQAGPWNGRGFPSENIDANEFGETPADCDNTVAGTVSRYLMLLGLSERQRYWLSSPLVFLRNSFNGKGLAVKK
jgi:hypothetical protein